MLKTDAAYRDCLKILEEELLPAMGCTEPISVAYCAAVARDALGELPDRVLIQVSGNIIKNVKSVFVPNTDGMRGIPAAAAAGIIACRPDKQLEVISEITEEQKAQIKRFLADVPIEVDLADTSLIFDIVITLFHKKSYAKVRIANFHTNIVLIEKDGAVLKSEPVDEDDESKLTDRGFLSVACIWDFVHSVDIGDVQPLLDRQIAYNMAISEEGLRGRYGANIGRVLLDSCPEVLSDENSETAIRLRARASAAAGSDARMSGCELPVVINSGSGNQGITASVPVIVYARAMGVSQEKMYRALILSNLLAIHQKTPIGRLSAYCGAINAGAAAGCGIAYLKGADLDAVSHTLVNALAIASGVVCDGAKASCAGKIALAVDTGILGYEMYQQGQQFYSGDGIVKKGAENMVASVGRLGRLGMAETDKEILRIMLDN